MPDSAQLAHDTAMLHQLITGAIGVELFTIPLYGTALYSIRGVYESTGPTLKWPGRKPAPVKSSNIEDIAGLTPEQATQRAYNEVFSVFIEEMLHMQLAWNLGQAVGLKIDDVSTIAPDYTSNPNSLPCVGPITGATVALREFNQDALDLFKLIETPDWDDPTPGPQPPFATMPTAFGTIGHLYEGIRYYINLKYDDGTYLFDTLYAPSTQVNVYGGEYLTTQAVVEKNTGITIVAGTNWATLPGGLDSTEARGIANLMIDAIVIEGEGADAAGAVPPIFRDDETATITQDEAEWESPDEAKNDAAVRSHWAAYSHYQRFENCQKLLASGKVQTWKTNPLTWQDLVVNGDEQAAKDRCAAFTSAELGTSLQDIVTYGYSGLLRAIQTTYAGGALFGMGGMKGLGGKITQIWVAGNGATPPTFAYTSKSAIPPENLSKTHACQGLNSCQSAPSIFGESHDCAGMCECAYADFHVCQNQNSCHNQAGCSFPGVQDQNQKYLATSPPNLFPNGNYDTLDGGQFAKDNAAGTGGCGVPIPATQLFTNPYSGVTVTGTNYSKDNPNGTAGPIPLGSSVWDRARWLFLKQVVPNLNLPAAKVQQIQADVEAGTVNGGGPTPLRQTLAYTDNAHT